MGQIDHNMVDFGPFFRYRTLFRHRVKNNRTLVIEPGLIFYSLWYFTVLLKRRKVSTNRATLFHVKLEPRVNPWLKTHQNVFHRVYGIPKTTVSHGPGFTLLVKVDHQVSGIRGILVLETNVLLPGGTRITGVKLSNQGQLLLLLKTLKKTRRFQNMWLKAWGIKHRDRGWQGCI